MVWIVANALSLLAIGGEPPLYPSGLGSDPPRPKRGRAFREPAALSPLFKLANCQGAIGATSACRAPSELRQLLGPSFF
jgi:hypothetical protein